MHLLQAKYWYLNQWLTWQKSHCRPRKNVNIAVLLLINASRNVHFLFFYVAWTKFRASFQLPHKRHRASESQNSKFNEQSKFKVKILLCKHNIYHSNIHHLVKEDIRYFFPQAVAQRCSIKKVFLETSQNSQGNTCARDPFLIKLQALGLQLY